MTPAKGLAALSAVLCALYVAIFAGMLIDDARAAQKAQVPAGVDYALFYAAGTLANEGNAALCYDTQAHHRMIEQTLDRQIDSFLGWLYPPTFLLVIAPLAALPFKVSLFVYLALTVGLLVLSLSALLKKGDRVLLLLALGFSGFFVNLRWGQNAFLSAALLGGALACWDAKPRLSGVLLGLLAFKPQLAFFPLLVLLLTKRWKPLLYAGATALVCALASLAAFGFDAWASFLRASLSSSAGQISADWANVYPLHASPLAALRLLGVGEPAGMIIQIAIIGAAAAGVLAVFRKTGDPALRGSAIVLGTLLATPYVLVYDLMLAAIPLVLLSVDFVHRGCRAVEIVLLFALWCTPFANISLAQSYGVCVAPAVLALIFALTLQRAGADKPRTALRRETL